MSQNCSLSTQWKNAPLKGILAMFISVAFFPVADAAIKYLVTTYSVQQTAFVRAIARIGSIVLASYLFHKGSSYTTLFATNEKWLHVKRVIANLISTFCFMWACFHGSLTLIYTLGYTSPLFMVILGALCLKERVSMARWGAVLIGLIGVSIAMEPWSHESDVGLSGLLVLIGAFFAAVNKMYMRKLAASESCTTIALYPNIAMLLITLPSMLNGWASMPFGDWLLVLVIGGALGVAQLLVAYALKCAESSLLAPIDYSTFLWVVLIDAFLWDKVPDRWTTIGAIIIILSNIWMITHRREEKERVTA